MKFEYLHTRIDAHQHPLDDRLDELGDDGWELVSHWIGREHWSHNFIFKRQKLNGYTSSTRLEHD